MLETRRQRILGSMEKQAFSPVAAASSIFTGAAAAPFKAIGGGIKKLIAGKINTRGPLAGTRKQFHKVKEFDAPAYKKLLAENPERAATLQKVTIGGKDRWVGRGTTYGGVVGSMQRNPMHWGGAGLLGYMMYPQEGFSQAGGQARPQQQYQAPIYPYERTL